MTRIMTLTYGSGMLDSQLSTEVKHTAPYGLSFLLGFVFSKRANVYYIPKEAGFIVSTKQKLTTYQKRLEAKYIQ